MNGRQSLGTHPGIELQFKFDKRDGAKSEAVKWTEKKNPYRADSLTALHCVQKASGEKRRSEVTCEGV